MMTEIYNDMALHYRKYSEKSYVINLVRNNAEMISEYDIIHVHRAQNDKIKCDIHKCV